MGDLEQRVRDLINQMAFEDATDREIALAIIPMALEDAAKVADDARDEWAKALATIGAENVVVQSHMAAAQIIATAIRALGEQCNGR